MHNDVDGPGQPNSHEDGEKLAVEGGIHSLGLMSVIDYICLGKRWGRSEGWGWRYNSQEPEEILGVDLYLS